MKTIKLSNNETIAYVDTGSDQPVLLLIHGNMTSSVHYDVLIDALKGDYRIIAPDLRGFGQSTYNNPVDCIGDFSEDIAELMGLLELKGCPVAGWSTGGGVALQLAADHPDLVSKLILIESVGIQGYPIFRKDEKGQPVVGDFLKDREEIAVDPVQVVPILDAYAAKNKDVLRAIWNALIYTVNEPEPERYEKYLEDMLTQRNLVDVDHALVWFNMSDSHNGVAEGSGDIHRVKAPALVFQGDRDLVVPPAMGEGIRDALGEQAVYVHGDWGHSPLMDCLDLLVKKMKDFMEQA